MIKKYKKKWIILYLFECITNKLCSTDFAVSQVFMGAETSLSRRYRRKPTRCNIDKYKLPLHITGNNFALLP